MTKPSLTPAVQYKELKTNCEATSQYREDEQRKGFNSNTPLKANLTIEKTLKPFNVGIHDASKSSPVIDDTGVYVGSDTGFFIKLSHQGELLWKFYVPGSLNGFHGTAALDEKKVYIGAYNGFMYALDKSNGELVWTNPVANYIGASPLLAAGALYISGETPHPDGLLVKLDCNTGETQWVSNWLGGHSHSSPTYDKKNNQIVVGSNSGRFFAFDSESGDENWNIQLKGQIKGTPMILDDTVFFGSWDKNYHALNLKDGSTKWFKFMGGRIQTSLTLVPGTQIGVTNTKVGEIIGINLSNGDILWRLRHGDRNHQFSILVTPNAEKPGDYIAWSRCKKTQLCALNAKTGKLIKNIKLPGSFTSVPVAYKDRLYITLDEENGLVILN